MPGKLFGILLDRAQEQYGYLTPADARKLDIDPSQLRLMAARGTLEHLGRGLYRMPAVPATSLDAYMEAVLWSGRQGVLSHETALDLYELCEVNPAAIHLTVPQGFRTRKAVPAVYRLHRLNLTTENVGWYEGIPVVTPRQAILWRHRAGARRAPRRPGHRHRPRTCTDRPAHRAYASATDGPTVAHPPRADLDGKQFVPSKPARLPRNMAHLQRLISEHAQAQQMPPARLQRWLNAMVITAVLDRVRDENDEPVFLLKGGIAMELRLRAARTHDHRL